MNFCCEMIPSEMGGEDLHSSDFIKQLRVDVAFLRRKKNLNQAQLAEIVGSSQSAISAFEDGKTVPRTKILNALINLRDLWLNDLRKSAPMLLEGHEFQDHARPSAAAATTLIGETPYTPTDVRPDRSEFVECANCGSVVEGPPRCVFCGVCAQPLGIACAECGTLETRLDSRYCRSCGAELPRQEPKKKPEPKPAPKKEWREKPPNDFFR
jgi:transcriptional regulator with XRE-family HTH domain